MFWVYILQNPESRFYVGHTEDVSRRLRQHNEARPGSGKYTNKNGPWTLMWSEPHPSRTLAMAREKEIKSWKSARTIRERLLNDSGRVPARRE